MSALVKTVNRTVKSRKVNPFNIVLFAVLLIYCIFFLILIVWGVFAALKPVDEFDGNMLGAPNGWPWDWAWSNFVFVFKKFTVPVTIMDGPFVGFQQEIGMGSLIGNTLLYTLPSALVATFVPCLAAYLTAKFPYRLSKIVYVTVIVTMVLPIVGNYPAELQLLKTLGLYNTFVGVWLQKANFLGMYFLVFYAIFKNLPNDFGEAASIDGASELRIFFRIMLPLCSTTFFTTMLIRFIEFWNDYQIPLLYMPSHPTLSFGLYSLYNSASNSLNNVPMRMASTILIIIPIIILFLCFKKRLMGNLSMGGLKG